MPASPTSHGDDPHAVDASLLALREQLLRADAQLDAAATQLRRDADLSDRLSRTTEERDALRREVERLQAEQQRAASPPPPPVRRAVALEPARTQPARTQPARTRPALRRRTAGAVVVAVAVLGGATAVAAQLRDDPGPRQAAAPTRSSAEPAPSAGRALGGTSGGQAATAPTAAAAPTAPATAANRPARAPLSPAVVPAGWRAHRAPDGSYALALPPGWRPAGPHRFVSASGLTVLSVRRGPLSASPTVADVVRDEKAVAASRPGYRRLALRALPFRGVPATVWDYRYGRGPQAQQVSDLALAVDGTGYGLRLQSRESAWRFAAPLRDGLRRSFAAPGLAPR